MVELILYGTDRTGKEYDNFHLVDIDPEAIGHLVNHYRICYPMCIHVRIDVAFPDPEYMKEKK